MRTQDELIPAADGRGSEIIESIPVRWGNLCQSKMYMVMMVVVSADRCGSPPKRQSQTWPSLLKSSPTSTLNSLTTDSRAGTCGRGPGQRSCRRHWRPAAQHAARAGEGGRRSDLTAGDKRESCKKALIASSCRQRFGDRRPIESPADQDVFWKKANIVRVHDDGTDRHQPS